MPKPFSIQAPEEVAKDYGGNKQRIAEAAQLGIVDPTAAVLAGMFIDRMRSAQMQEVRQMPTIAQQVMGGAQPAPASSPSGGVGMSSAGAPPMAPPQPAMPPQMGMAEGGLLGINIPDAMFDEPSNGSYAGGGLVAFAKGGMADLYDDVEYTESRGRQSAVSPKGARGVMQLMPGTMRDPGFGVTPMRANTEEENRRVGREYLDAMYAKYGDRATALMAYNWGPGKVDKWIASGRDPSKVPAETRKYVSSILGGDAQPTGGLAALREADTSTAAGRAASLEDSLMLGRELTSGLPREELERAKADALAMLDPEAQKKDRERDMWQSLAEMGFRMASSTSPYVLQAIGEAAVATLPGIEASKKERQAAKDNAIKTLMAAEDVDRKTALAGVETGMSIFKSGLDQEQFQQTMEMRKAELTSREMQAQLDRAAQLEAQKISAMGKMSDTESLAEALFQKFKLRAEQGKLLDAQGNKYPPNLAIAELRAMAMEAAIKATRKPTGGTGAGEVDLNGDGVPDSLGGGGGAPPAGPWMQYQQ